MPEKKSSNLNELAMDIDRQIARNDFLIALLEIERFGIDGLPVDGNPLRELRQRIWPAWHDAMHPKTGNTKRRRYRDFCSKIEERNQAIAAMADQIEHWARACHLVERDELGKLRPAGWVVKFAWECCDLWSKKALGIFAAQTWWSRASLMSLHPGAGSNAIETVNVSFHLDDVTCRQGESRKEFNRRRLRAVRAVFEKNGEDFACPAPVGGSRIGRPKKAKKTESDSPHRYKWLILYQCCGWKQSRISQPPYQRTQQAVSDGLRSAAKAVGLVVRERAVTNKKPKTPPKSSLK
jgi:hypothetical protein